MAENVKSHRRSDVPDEVLALLHTARRIGYGLLVGAIIVDVLSFQFAARARTFTRKQCSVLFDEVVPNPTPVLDLALVLLGASDVRL